MDIEDTGDSITPLLDLVRNVSKSIYVLDASNRITRTGIVPQPLLMLPMLPLTLVMPMRTMIEVAPRPSHNVIKTLCLITNKKALKVGQTYQVDMLCEGTTIKVLMDTGSPMSFIRSDIPHELELSKFTAPWFRFKEMVPKGAVITTEVVNLELIKDTIKVEEAVYVRSHLWITKSFLEIRLSQQTRN